VQREIGMGCINPAKFRKQIVFLLESGYEFVTLQELSLRKDARNLIALTFDDGYQGVFTYAFPILRAYNIPATVFLITNYLGVKNTWDINLGGIKHQHLAIPEIMELVRNGWEVGSHGISHRMLIGMSGSEIHAELLHSKQLLEHRFSTDVRYFCAPFGKLNRKVIAEAKTVGYKGICGFYPFKYYKSLPPDFIILRLAVYSFDSLKAIENKLAANWRIRREIIKQNVVNFCANGSIIVQNLK